jgi:hypothetical protein
MFLLMAVGYFLYKKHWIDEVGSKQMSKMLISLIIPTIIIKSYLVEFSTEKLTKLGWAAVATTAALGLSMLVCHLLYGSRAKIDNIGVAFSNAGFVGIPLVSAVLGDEAVFYVSVYVALLNFLQQTYGIMVMTGRKDSVRMKNVVTNPVLLGFVIGLVLFVTPVELPSILVSCVGYIANLNTPIAMIILGVYLAQTKLSEIFSTLRLYLGSVVRLILIPLLTFALLTVLPLPSEIRMTVLIAASTPVGSNVAVLAQLNGLDYSYASKLVCSTTLISIVTVPLMVTFANILW